MTTRTNDHLTVLETAALLRVHPRTVWRYIKRGKLTPVRHPLNRRVYLNASEVRAAQEATARTPYPERSHLRERE